MDDHNIVKFSDSYSLASSVWSLFFESPQDEIETLLESYFRPYCRHRIRKLAEPHRWTLLHHYIHSLFWDLYEDFEHHSNDMLDLIIQEYVTILNFYEISYPSFVIPDETSDDYEYKASTIISCLRALLPSVRIVNDTFQLLFGDRVFLLKFNQEIAHIVQKCVTVEGHPNFAEKDGVLKRVYLPQWLKRAVFYRDRGRCVVCGKDLTGTVSRGEEVHYDHIVPLSQGGTNDPTNFQLMCKECNLKKAQQIKTSDVYQTHWNLDKEALQEAEAYAQVRIDVSNWFGIKRG